jgi:hypothetical protein
LRGWNEGPVLENHAQGAAVAGRIGSNRRQLRALRSRHENLAKLRAGGRFETRRSVRLARQEAVHRRFVSFGSGRTRVVRR